MSPGINTKRVGGRSGITGSEVQAHLAQFHYITGTQELGANALAVHPSPVGGIQIANLKRAIGQMINLGMVTRYGIIIETQVVIRRPAQSAQRRKQAQFAPAKSVGANESRLYQHFFQRSAPTAGKRPQRKFHFWLNPVEVGASQRLRPAGAGGGLVRTGAVGVTTIGLG